ncbi:MAG: acyl-CoA reductase [Bacteroidetes bacterium]|nr:MAG: acyl-CoA reductase [Bacteroidota bacterium]
MTREERIAGFSQLTRDIHDLDTGDKEELFRDVANNNPWFTAENIDQALNGLAYFLTPETLNNWLDNYTLPHEYKKIGIVMAGNIPLVGFHDFLSVIMAGHMAVIKLSSQDKVLFPVVLEMLLKINPNFGEQISVVDKLTEIDGVIATGSDNSSRYFKKYFKNMPNIIRKNRSSVAVLNGNETTEELQLLGDDIFSYFGLGCRNVAKIFVPEGHDMTGLLDALEGHQEIINHPKYFNNYEYNKAIYLVNRTQHLDTGYALFTQNKDIVSPLAVIYYEEYKDESELLSVLELNTDKIQCIVSNYNIIENRVPIGKSQLPEIDDYADNVNTMSFLCDI